MIHEHLHGLQCHPFETCPRNSLKRTPIKERQKSSTWNSTSFQKLPGVLSSSPPSANPDEVRSLVTSSRVNTSRPKIRNSSAGRERSGWGEVSQRVSTRDCNLPGGAEFDFSLDFFGKVFG